MNRTPSLSKRRRALVPARVVLLVTALTFACATDPNDTPPGVTFRVESAVYTVGESVRVTTTNSSWVAFSYGSLGCTQAMERRVGDEWVIADPDMADGVACDAAGYNMPAGASGTSVYAWEDWMVPGEYRFRRSVTWPANGGRGYMLVSNTFQIVDE